MSATTASPEPEKGLESSELHASVAEVKAMALIREFHDGTARKDWEAWGFDVIAILRAALARRVL